MSAAVRLRAAARHLGSRRSVVGREQGMAADSGAPHDGARIRHRDHRLGGTCPQSIFVVVQNIRGSHILYTVM